MALYDKASLVLIPSGTKEGVIFSQKPTNGDGDFTFSRSTAATRVNADGLIEKETQNLLTHSGDLTNADYVQTGISYNGTQTDPNGGSKAFSYTSNSTNGQLRQNNTLSTGVYTFSVYLKSTTNLAINIRLDSNNGTFENYPCGLTTEWQRFEFFYVHNSATLGAWIGGGLSWTTGEEVHIAFPQLEEGLVARDYIETTTSAVYGGITDNVPRIDYTDSSCPSLLLEPQRTNLVPNSEDFSGFSYNNQTSTSNAAISPDGTQNATLIESTTTASSYIADTTASVTIGNTYTFSVFAKKGNNNWIRTAHISSSTTAAWFDLENGVVGTVNSTSATIEDYGNGWYKCTNTFVATDSSGNLTFIGICDDDNSTNAGASGQNDYIWGWQLEQGSYATSYIPTYGTSVTFAQDSCSKTGVSDLIGQTEGTLFLDFKLPKIATPQNHTWVALKDSAQNNRILVYFLANSETLRAQIKASGSAANHNLGTISNGDRVKVAIAYKSGDSAIYVNGSSTATNTNALSFGTMDIIDFNDSSAPFEGDANKLLVFPTRLSNEELATLTTL